MNHSEFIVNVDIVNADNKMTGMEILQIHWSDSVGTLCLVSSHPFMVSSMLHTKRMLLCV